MTKFTSDDYGEGYWERAEGSNYRNYGDDPGWRGIIRVMDQFHGIGDRILEVACAKGYFVAHARRAGYEAFGFDISEYAISKAHPAAQEFVSVHDATNPWPVEHRSFDAVVGWEFLEHIREEDMGLVVSEAVKALKPKGLLWFKTGILVPDGYPYENHDEDHTHVNMQNREYWEYQFESFGLEPVREAESLLDAEFANRDWVGRFFVWEKPL